MATLTRVLGAGLAVALVGAVVVASPAGAAGDLVVAQAAGVSISQTGSSASLALAGGGDPVFDPDDAQQVVGTLPATTLTISTILTNATVTVSGTALTAGGGASTVPASNVTVLFAAADLGALQSLLSALGGLLGGATVTAATLEGTSSNLATPYALIRASTGLLTGGSITYTPVVRVTIPAGTAAGTYTGTISQVAS